MIYQLYINTTYFHMLFNANQTKISMTNTRSKQDIRKSKAKKDGNIGQV